MPILSLLSILGIREKLDWIQDASTAEKIRKWTDSLRLILIYQLVLKLCSLLMWFSRGMCHLKNPQLLHQNILDSYKVHTEYYVWSVMLFKHLHLFAEPLKCIKICELDIFLRLPTQVSVSSFQLRNVNTFCKVFLHSSALGSWARKPLFLCFNHHIYSLWLKETCFGLHIYIC